MPKIIVLSFILFFSLITPALAEDDARIVSSNAKNFLEKEAAIVEPGLLPDSFWYWTDIYSEELRYLFTVGGDNKIDYLISLAEERLAEMKAMSDKSVNVYSEDLLNKYEAHIKLATDLYLKIREDLPGQIQEAESDFEREILLQEYRLRKEAKQAPAIYKEQTDSIYKQISTGFKSIVSHLSWKRGEIKQQRAQFEE